MRRQRAVRLSPGLVKCVVLLVANDWAGLRWKAQQYIRRNAQVLSQCADLPNGKRADSAEKFGGPASASQPFRQVRPRKPLLLQDKIDHFLGSWLLESRHMSVFISLHQYRQELQPIIRLGPGRRIGVEKGIDFGDEGF